GIISDIHSNLLALEAVLAALREREVDAHLCLGDIVGYGPNPNECCELVRELDGPCILGNHDEAVLKPGTEDWFNAYAAAAVLWTRAVLTEENADLLRSLEEQQVIGDLTMVHGALEDPWGYITEPYEATTTFELMRTPVCLVGHSHFAEWYELDPDNPRPRHVPATNGRTLTLAEDMRYIVNPGSVGQPRDRDSRASCALYDEDARTIEIIRTPYDIKACQQEMLEKGLPPALAYRLMFGV
ncbi:MAG: metallophosphoesterase family protein, partial [Armatimonadota bacterium]